MISIFPLQILIAIVLLLKWSSQIEIDERYHFFDVFAGAANCSRAWSGP